MNEQISHQRRWPAPGRHQWLPEPHRDFSLLIQKRLGVRFVVHITAPLCVLWLVSRAAEWIAARRGTLSTLNSDKYRIMKQRNWRCDITPAVEELGYKPAYDLRRGVEETFSPKA